jgi:hypothetical protein
MLDITVMKVTAGMRVPSSKALVKIFWFVVEGHHFYPMCRTQYQESSRHDLVREKKVDNCILYQLFPGYSCMLQLLNYLVCGIVQINTSILGTHDEKVVGEATRNSFLNVITS